MVHVAWRDFRSPDGREGWFPASVRLLVVARGRDCFLSLRDPTTRWSGHPSGRGR